MFKRYIASTVILLLLSTPMVVQAGVGVFTNSL